MIAITLDRDRHDIGTGFPVPGSGEPGDRDECGFAGATLEEGMCREIPVAIITQECPRGHSDLLRACRGHAEEVTGWDDDLSDGALTCPMCENDGESPACRVSVLVIWDDMRPLAVVQER